LDTDRAAWLRGMGRRRHDAHNKGTVALSEVTALAPAVLFQERFKRHYDDIRELVHGCSGPGLLAMAIDHQGPVAAAYVGARSDRITTLVVGRHSKADLWLEEDPSLSLRQMIVLLHPHRASADLRFRVIDLNTAVAFSDERGRRLRAFEAESPVFVSCARYGIYLFPTDGSLAWPEDAESGWACIPDRVLLDDRVDRPVLRPQHVPGARRAGTLWLDRQLGRSTMVALERALLARRSMVERGEEPLGVLELECEGRRAAILLGAAAARRGVLLGREPRCDGEALDVLRCDRVSRVHLLIIEVAGALYAVDAASSYGLWRGAEPVRAVPLRHGTELALSGPGVARLRWREVN